MGKEQKGGKELMERDPVPEKGEQDPGRIERETGRTGNSEEGGGAGRGYERRLKGKAGERLRKQGEKGMRRKRCGERRKDDGVAAKG